MLSNGDQSTLVSRREAYKNKCAFLDFLPFIIGLRFPSFLHIFISSLSRRFLVSRGDGSFTFRDDVSFDGQDGVDDDDSRIHQTILANVVLVPSVDDGDDGRDGDGVDGGEELEEQLMFRNGSALSSSSSSSSSPPTELRRSPPRSGAEGKRHVLRLRMVDTDCYKDSPGWVRDVLDALYFSFSFSRLTFFFSR